MFSSCFKAAQDVGINSVTRKLSDTTSEDELLKIIDELNNSNDVDGILVQLPLPPHMTERKVSHESSTQSCTDLTFFSVDLQFRELC